jgi:hypothetical protein
MELILNIVWVLIALASFVAWRAFWKRQARLAPRESLWEWTALICALILLFFPISMSDDLHCDLLLFDICSVNRRQAGASFHAAPQQLSTHSVRVAGAAAPSRFAPFEPRPTAALLVALETYFLSGVSGNPPCVRAPPSHSAIG